MSLERLLMPSCVVLFMAPPAWGKTYMLSELYLKTDKKMVFVSPLRALAEEFALKFKKALIAKTHKDAKKVYKKFFQAKKAILITTAELMQEEFLFELEVQKENVIVVLDEFHLFYKWGLDFRPILLETLMGLGVTQAPLLFLSATINERLLSNFIFDFKHVSENIFLLNLGNQRLKYLPHKTYTYSFSRKAFIRRFIYEVLHNSEENLLFFCEYRAEVDFWVDFFKRKKVNVLSCKGGEVLSFTQNLKFYKSPGVIISTTTLSHGVNLPSISKVFLSYKVRDKDMWLQMAARGGRYGENFNLYCLNNFLKMSFFQKIVSFLSIVIFDFYLKVKSFII